MVGFRKNIILYKTLNGLTPYYTYFIKNLLQLASSSSSSSLSSCSKDYYHLRDAQTAPFIQHSFVAASASCQPILPKSCRIIRNLNHCLQNYHYWTCLRLCYPLRGVNVLARKKFRNKEQKMNSWFRHWNQSWKNKGRRKKRELKTKKTVSLKLKSPSRQELCKLSEFLSKSN